MAVDSIIKNAQKHTRYEVGSIGKAMLSRVKTGDPQEAFVWQRGMLSSAKRGKVVEKLW